MILYCSLMYVFIAVAGLTAAGKVLLGKVWSSEVRRWKQRSGSGVHRPSVDVAPPCAAGDLLALGV